MQQPERKEAMTITVCATRCHTDGCETLYIHYLLPLLLFTKVAAVEIFPLQVRRSIIVFA